MRSFVLLPLLLLNLVALPATGQGQAVDTTQVQSDRQLRQRVSFALSRAENERTELDALIAHLRLSYAAIHARIVRDSLRAVTLPPQDTVTPPPPPPPPDTTPSDPAGVAFRSSWTSGTGNTMSAVQDGGKWNQSWCSHQDVLSVVPGSTVGWTVTANALQVTNRGETRCWQIETTNSVPQGISYFIRFYAMVDTENQTNFHPVAIMVGDGVVPTQMSPWSIESPTTTGWQAALRYSARFLPYADFAWKSDLILQRRVWYRFEYHVELLGSRFRVWPRIYDMAGNLIQDARNFHHLDGGARSLQDFYNAGGASAFNTLDALRRFGVGYEGSAGAAASGGRWYYAAVELRTDTWPGPVR